MPVSSYVIRCAPRDQRAVLQELGRIPGLLIGEATDAGVPVAAEADTTRAAQEIGNRLQELPGVRSALLVYHNFEDVVDDRE